MAIGSSQRFCEERFTKTWSPPGAAVYAEKSLGAAVSGARSLLCSGLCRNSR